MLNFLSSCFGASNKLTTSSSDGFVGTTKYVNYKLGKFQEGLSFTITGTINPTGTRFIIDFGLENSTKDIALRLRALVAENMVIRNAMIKNNWGTDETSTEIPFTLDAGSLFQIQVLFTIESIMVAVDGFHIGKFEHRLPFHEICSLAIKGDVKDIHVRRKIVTDYPARTKKSKNFVSIAERHISTGNYDLDDYSSGDDNDVGAVWEAGGGRRPLPLPYYASFPKGFFDMGYSMSISGHVKKNAHVFSASLQSGHHTWPQPAVTLFMEFRFIRRSDSDTGEPVVLRKSFFNGQWSNEKSSELATGLRPGANFDLVIFRGGQSFEISMNNKPLTDYPYVVNPRNIDTVLVAGDLFLFDIEIEEKE